MDIVNLVLRRARSLSARLRDALLDPVHGRAVHGAAHCDLLLSGHGIGRPANLPFAARVRLRRKQAHDAGPNVEHQPNSRVRASHSKRPDQVAPRCGEHAACEVSASLTHFDSQMPESSQAPMTECRLRRRRCPAFITGTSRSTAGRRTLSAERQPDGPVWRGCARRKRGAVRVSWRQPRRLLPAWPGRGYVRPC
ncbi:hypothetical protein ABIB85_008173 [Bradyrhizobium sp. JR1.5]